MILIVIGVFGTLASGILERVSGRSHCTEAGCTSRLRVVLPGTIRDVDQPKVTVCYGSICETESVAASDKNEPSRASSRSARNSGDEVDVDFPSDDINPKGMPEVNKKGTMSITLVDSEGTVVRETTREIELETLAPNGVDCGPVCYAKTITLSRGWGE